MNIIGIAGNGSSPATWSYGTFYADLVLEQDGNLFVANYDEQHHLLGLEKMNQPFKDYRKDENGFFWYLTEEQDDDRWIDTSRHVAWNDPDFAAKLANTHQHISKKGDFPIFYQKRWIVPLDHPMVINLLSSTQVEIGDALPDFCGLSLGKLVIGLRDQIGPWLSAELLTSVSDDPVKIFELTGFALLCGGKLPQDYRQQIYDAMFKSFEGRLDHDASFIQSAKNILHLP